MATKRARLVGGPDPFPEENLCASANADHLLVDELVGAQTSHLAAGAGPLDAAEGQLHAVGEDDVHEHHARLDLVGHALRASGLFRGRRKMMVNHPSRKKLDTLTLLQHACGAVSVLRSLKQDDRTTTYKPFAVAIGLIKPGGAWEPWHRRQVSDVLDLAALVAKHTGETLDFARVINLSGEPGVGLNRKSHFVRAAATSMPVV